MLYLCISIYVDTYIYIYLCIVFGSAWVIFFFHMMIEKREKKKIVFKQSKILPSPDVLFPLFFFVSILFYHKGVYTFSNNSGPNFTSMFGNYQITNTNTNNNNNNQKKYHNIKDRCIYNDIIINNNNVKRSCFNCFMDEVQTRLESGLGHWQQRQCQNDWVSTMDNCQYSPPCNAIEPSPECLQCCLRQYRIAR